MTPRRSCSLPRIIRFASTSPPGSPLRPFAPSPHPSLPRPLTPLVGRQSAVQEIASGLGSARLITLTRPGGIGKTRLAIQVAEAIRTAFPDGIGFVELGAVTEPALVPQSTARALGLQEAGDRPLAETLREYLAPRCALLVMDNCEHLLAACAHRWRIIC